MFPRIMLRWCQVPKSAQFLEWKQLEGGFDVSTHEGYTTLPDFESVFMIKHLDSWIRLDRDSRFFDMIFQEIMYEIHPQPIRSDHFDEVKEAWDELSWCQST